MLPAIEVSVMDLLPRPLPTVQFTRASVSAPHEPDELTPSLMVWVL